MEIITPRLVLREFRESDFDAVWAYQSLPESNYYYDGAPSQEDELDKLRTAVSDAQKVPRIAYRLAVTIRPDDLPKGAIQLKLQYAESREWEMGWRIAPALWGQGYATEAARGVLDYAFKVLNVHKVVAFCKTLNVASWRVMEKLGMTRDGLLREDRIWNGAWSDAFVYSILEREWAALADLSGG